MPVILSRVNSQFVQTGGSCVLSSYAIVAEYFSNKKTGDAFMAYCDHFGIAYTNAQDAEVKYELHFDYEWRTRTITGYQVIKDLHDNSIEPYFMLNRNKFSAIFHPETNFQQLEQDLKSNDSFLNLTYIPARSKDYHSVTYCHDGSDFWQKDTNKTALTRHSTIAHPNVRDSMYYEKI